MIRMGASTDMPVNQSRVYLKYMKVPPGKKRKKEAYYLWADEASLAAAVQRPSPARSEERRSPRVAMREMQEQQREEQRTQQEQEAMAALPAGAAIERERKLPQKVPAPVRGRQRAERKTKESNVSLDKRLQQFPGHSLGIRGGKLRCLACKTGTYPRLSTRIHACGHA